jgi:hypothetical protein
VTVCLHRTDVRSERARRFCLDRLLAELSSRGVDRVVVESRNEALDARDRAVLTGMRRAGVVRPVMEVRWDLASAHPALWAADCFVGLVTSWLGGDEEMHGGLERRITVIDVDAP